MMPKVPEFQMNYCTQIYFNLSILLKKITLQEFLGMPRLGTTYQIFDGTDDDGKPSYTIETTDQYFIFEFDTH